ncbi:conjugal transfer protein TraR [Escherichia coli]|nr:conjugal transfer protein TraR [Escherichia coli]MDW3282199.1 conjugal transfer protein TraR [Escherichia coli]MDW3340961.1 conjugal transfer protein TraR [Escherichia coli]MDW4642093.1 conjugal transfer protein TraR [Escherichia coli]WJL88385.1 conjugal transfer protein TraR [Escherichia coli O2:K1:H4]
MWQPEFTDKTLSRKPGAVQIRQKINAHGIPVYLCEACGNPIPEARRKIFPGVTLCVECQAYQERQRKHYA